MLRASEHVKTTQEIALFQIRFMRMENSSIKIRTTHEVTAGRTDEFAFVIVQFVPASCAVLPILTIWIHFSGSFGLFFR